MISKRSSFHAEWRHIQHKRRHLRRDDRRRKSGSSYRDRTKDLDAFLERELRHVRTRVFNLLFTPILNDFPIYNIKFYSNSFNFSPLLTCQFKYRIFRYNNIWNRPFKNLDCDLYLFCSLSLSIDWSLLRLESNSVRSITTRSNRTRFSVSVSSSSTS